MPGSLTSVIAASKARDDRSFKPSSADLTASHSYAWPRIAQSRLRTVGSSSTISILGTVEGSRPLRRHGSEAKGMKTQGVRTVTSYQHSCEGQVKSPAHCPARAGFARSARFSAPSLVPERHGRGDLRGPPRRYVTGQQGHGTEQQRDGGERRGVVGAHAVEEAARQARQRERRGQ